jgi:NAD(P)-dependent dehydrogenase (short-subunit alcohol dehydrogenase family)
MPERNESQLSRKTVLLTGASRGIGHATVKLFYQHGWRVLTVSRAPFTPNCPWPGGRDDHIQADLADPACYQPMAAEVR